MGTFGSHHLSPGKMMLGSFLTKKDGFQWLPKADSAPSPDCPFLSLMLCKDNVLRVIAVPHVATSGSFYLSSTLIPPPGGGSTEENRKGGEGRLLADSGARSLPAGVLRPCPPAGSRAARAQGQPSVCVWVAQPPWRIWRRPEEQIGGGLAWPGSGLAGTQACFPPGLPPAVPRTRWGPMRCPESARELASRVSPGQDCCSCCLELSVESFLCLKERPLVSAVRYPGI